MRITDVEPIVLRLDHVDTTRADGTQDAFLVRVHTDEGIVGVGEADTSPYLARTIIEMPSSHSIARGLREVLVDEDPLQIDRLWQLMFHASDHYGRGGAALHAISAIDIALWDIAGKAAGRPISDLLGGRRIVDVPVYASEVMPETAEEVRRIAERAADAGYDALKLGWGPLGRDLAPASGRHPQYLSR
jgi:L-alanine-DL-glutamate epimerase-like enolase superfamily enzyme